MARLRSSLNTRIFPKTRGIIGPTHSRSAQGRKPGKHKELLPPGAIFCKGERNEKQQVYSKGNVQRSIITLSREGILRGGPFPA